VVNIKNVKSYYLKFKEPKKLISDITNQILMKKILSSSFEELLLNRVWVGVLKNKIQKELDSLNTGINILSFTVQDIHPPKNVAGAFEKLVATRQELLTLKKRAESYRDLKLMNAKTEAFSMIKEAKRKSYKDFMIVSGNSEKDFKIADIFNKYTYIVKKYIYYNMIAETLPNNKKILIDDSSNVELRFKNKDLI